jgi:hypothetical protein
MILIAGFQAKNLLYFGIGGLGEMEFGRWAKVLICPMACGE